MRIGFPDPTGGPDTYEESRLAHQQSVAAWENSHEAQPAAQPDLPPPHDVDPVEALVDWINELPNKKLQAIRHAEIARAMLRLCVQPIVAEGERNLGKAVIHSVRLAPHTGKGERDDVEIYRLSASDLPIYERFLGTELPDTLTVRLSSLAASRRLHDGGISHDIAIGMSCDELLLAKGGFVGVIGGIARRRFVKNYMNSYDSAPHLLLEEGVDDFVAAGLIYEWASRIPHMSQDGEYIKVQTQITTSLLGYMLAAAENGVQTPPITGLSNSAQQAIASPWASC